MAVYDRQTNRQTDRQTDRQAGRETDRQRRDCFAIAITVLFTDINMTWSKNLATSKQTDRQTFDIFTITALANSHIKAQNGRDKEVDGGPEHCLTSLLHLQPPPMNSLKHVRTDSLVISLSHLTLSTFNTDKCQALCTMQHHRLASRQHKTSRIMSSNVAFQHWYLETQKSHCYQHFTHTISRWFKTW